MNNISLKTPQVAVTANLYKDYTDSSLPFTENHPRSLLNAEDQRSEIEGSPVLPEMYHLRLSKPTYYRIRTIRESISYDNSNKTQQTDAQKKVDPLRPTCCECGKILAHRIVTLLLCGHIICTKCTTDIVASASPDPNKPERGKIFKCPYLKLYDTHKTCLYSCSIAEISIDYATERLSIEGYTNCSVQGIPALEEHILCKIYLNHSYTNEEMTLKEAIQKLHDAKKNP